MTISLRFFTFSKKLWQEWLKPMALAAAIVFPLKSTLADLNWVPTGSMKPTILEGDLVFVDKLAYDLKVPFTLFRLAEWQQPKVGEIVVFFSPHDGTRLVKRVIAGPGDTVAMQDNVLYRNGRRLDYAIQSENPFLREVYEDPLAIVARERGNGPEHWVMAFPSRPSLQSFGPITVPAGKYFMMGDSRDNSLDSRFFGFVDRKQIVGRAGRVMMSLDIKHFCLPRFGRTLSALDS